MMAARKAWLYPLVLAECASWQGKYIAAIRTTLRELATQPAWAGPATDPTMRGINHGDWYQDLLSTALAHELAQALYLLGDRVDADTRTLVTAALETRVFQPVRRTLVDGYNSWWLTVSHNWNAVMLADVVGAALAVIPSRQDRARFAAVGQQYIQSFVAPFPESGYGLKGLVTGRMASSISWCCVTGCTSPAPARSTFSKRRNPGRSASTARESR